mgnify:CR=1 FL=1
MTKLRSEISIQPIWWICLGAIAVLLFHVATRLPDGAEVLVGDAGDDVMRLQQVRDWLAGQPWFDTFQYRLLPPEGVSMHWSRYVDLGIAAFLVPASWFLPATQAEIVAVTLWPTLLGTLIILLIGHANNRLMGPAAAIGALIAFLGWGKLVGEFGVGRLDHHNIQILCAAAIFYLSVVPGKARLFGALAGFLTAFSLAVGLEMLPFLATVWGMMVIRHAFAETGMGSWLAGFCCAFAISAPLLLAGQTPVSGWWINHCDVLAPPVLTLAAIGIVATLSAVALAGVLPNPVARLFLPLAITALGLWLAAPVLVPCLAGPYADSAPEVREVINTLMVEALPASIMLKTNPAMFLTVMLPAVVIAVLAAGAIWLMRAKINRTLCIAFVQAYVVLLVGFALALLQIRAANLMTPAVPLLAGFLVHGFATIPRENRLRVPAILVLMLASPVIVEHLSRTISLQLKPLSPSTIAAARRGPNGEPPNNFCRNLIGLAEIDSLPKSIVFSSMNLGPGIIAFTKQSATSAGYHRSDAAYLNGVFAFRDLDALRSSLTSSNADYLVICRGAHDERFIAKLDEEGWPNWLTDVTGDRKQLLVYKVDKAALAASMSGP